VRRLADHVDPLTLGHPVNGRHHLAVEGGADGLAPPVVVARAPAEQGASQGTARVKVEALAMVGPDEVEGVALSEQVGAVAGNPVRRRPHGDPFASQWEPHDHRAGRRCHGQFQSGGLIEPNRNLPHPPVGQTALVCSGS
jgi:hypothetical protein